MSEQPILIDVFITSRWAGIAVSNKDYKELRDEVINEKIKKYEDSIQFISAVNSGCEYIVTRNKKDFPENGIKIVSPVDFINIIMKMGADPAIC